LGLQATGDNEKDECKETESEGNIHDISVRGKDVANGGRLCEEQSLISDSRKRLRVVNHFFREDPAFAA
jgi:hypothetical protein